MIPHCHESHAYLNHESKTTKGQYNDFLAVIQKRVEATLASTNIANSKQVARTAAKGVYILSYWVNL